MLRSVHRISSTKQSRANHRAISKQSQRNHRAITSHSNGNHGAIIEQSRANHWAITEQPQSNHEPITMTELSRSSSPLSPSALVVSPCHVARPTVPLENARQYRHFHRRPWPSTKACCQTYLLTAAMRRLLSTVRTLLRTLLLLRTMGRRLDRLMT